jgi:hypothetical protein
VELFHHINTGGLHPELFSPQLEQESKLKLAWVQGEDIRERKGKIMRQLVVNTSHLPRRKRLAKLKIWVAWEVQSH